MFALVKSRPWLAAFKAAALGCITLQLLILPPVVHANGLGGDIPLPPRRPINLGVLVETVAPRFICQRDTGYADLEGVLLEPLVGVAGCGMVAPVQVSAILLRDGGKVLLQPPPTINCALATTLADWVALDVVPAIAQGDTLVKIDIAGAYECRGRNRLLQAKLSEHATGNAIDVSAFQTRLGQNISVAATGKSPLLFKSLAASACQRFMTVLGPGSDIYHASHLHLDVQARAKGSHFCQWRVF